MFKTIALLSAVALALAVPQPNILEDFFTAAIHYGLAPFDPSMVGSLGKLNLTTSSDTSLIFSFQDITFADFADMECTKFTVSPLTKMATVGVRIPTLNINATHYVADGTLNGQPFTGSGVGELAGNNLTLTLKFHIESLRLAFISLCVTEGSFNVDLAADSFEANFENGDALNEELNSHGPLLMESIQSWFMERSDFIVDLVNEVLCLEQ